MKINKLNIGGRVISVRSESSDDHLAVVSEELNARIDAVQSVIPDSHEALLFVALALTDELINTQNRLDEIQGATERKVHTLLNLLEDFQTDTLTQTGKER